MVKGGVDLEGRDSRGFKALHYAVYGGLNDLVGEMLNNGVNVDPIDNEFGVTPLYIAAINGNNQLCKLLLDYGADSSLTSSKYGYSPFEVLSTPGAITTSDARNKLKIPKRVFFSRK